MSDYSAWTGGWAMSKPTLKQEFEWLRTGHWKYPQYAKARTVALERSERAERLLERIGIAIGSTEAEWTKHPEDEARRVKRERDEAVGHCAAAEDQIVEHESEIRFQREVNAKLTRERDEARGQISDAETELPLGDEECSTWTIVERAEMFASHKDQRIAELEAALNEEAASLRALAKRNAELEAENGKWLERRDEAIRNERAARGDQRVAERERDEVMAQKADVSRLSIIFNDAVRLDNEQDRRINEWLKLHIERGTA